MNQSHIDALHQLTDERRLIDEIVKTIKANVGSDKITQKAYVTLALRQSERAFMWLGRAKGAIGSGNPYPHSSNPASNIIEKPQDIFDGELFMVSDELAEPELTFCKQVRSLLGTVEPMVKNDLMILENNRDYQRAVEQSLISLIDAKMYLGQALGGLRDNNPGKYPTSTAPAQDPSPLKKTPPAAAKPAKGKSLVQRAVDAVTPGKKKKETKTKDKNEGKQSNNDNSGK